MNPRYIVLDVSVFHIFRDATFTKSSRVSVYVMKILFITRVNLHNSTNPHNSG